MGEGKFKIDLDFFLVCACRASGLFYRSLIFTGEWQYVMWSFMVSMVCGVPSLIMNWQAQKKANQNRVNVIHTDY